MGLGLALLSPGLRPRGEATLNAMAHALRGWLLGQMFGMAFTGVFTFLGLWALGVPLAQGYFLARPAPAFVAPAPDLAARLAARTRVVSGSVAELLEPLGDDVPRSAMTMLPETPIEDAALRALARPADVRFDPIVVHDELGRPVGAVRFERLVARLAQS